jgi:tRNA splicing ligase
VTANGAHIEGFVIEDANKYHVKIKLDFYSFWKQLRSALDAVKAGKQPKIKQESKYPELAQEVIDFIQQLPATDLARDDIIAVRAKFFAKK